jgi:hypothetical protein
VSRDPLPVGVPVKLCLRPIPVALDQVPVSLDSTSVGRHPILVGLPANLGLDRIPVGLGPALLPDHDDSIGALVTTDGRLVGSTPRM